MDKEITNFDYPDSVVSLAEVFERLRKTIKDRAEKFVSEPDVIVCVVHPRDIPEFLSWFGKELKE